MSILCKLWLDSRGINLLLCYICFLYFIFYILYFIFYVSKQI